VLETAVGMITSALL